MPLEIKVQFDIIIYAILAGGITGVIFDLYRIVRGVKVPKVIMIVEDFLFWIFAAITIFTFLLYTNYAFLGVYVYAFIIIALLIYFKLISSTFYKYEVKVVEGIYWFTRIVFKRFVYILRLIFYYASGKINSK